MLEVDPNLERNLTSHQVIKEILALCYKVYDQGKKSSIQTTLHKIFTNKENTLILNVSNV